MKSRNLLLAIITIALSAYQVTSIAQTLSVTNPEMNESFLLNSEIQFEAEYQSDSISFSKYLRVWNNQTGYRKLKLGNNPNQVYSPKVNVTEGGNTTMKVTMKIPGAGTDWSKMQIRPQAISTNAPKLSAYIGSNPPLNTWIEVNIPLADFDSSIDFSAISYLEFPYSAGADNFEILIGEILFTGGSTVYTWLGNDELNVHNGNGGPGEVYAQWVINNSNQESTPVIQFWLNDELVGSDNDEPYLISWTSQSTGSYSLLTKAFIDDTLIVESEAISFLITDQNVEFPDVQWSNNTFPAELPVGASVMITGTLSGDTTGIEIQLLDNNTLVTSSTESSFELLYTGETTGAKNLHIQLSHESGALKSLMDISTTVIQATSSENAQITSPEDGQAVYIDSELAVTATYSSSGADYPYMLITNPGTGYRKLKIANNPYNIWSPKIDLLSGGNTRLEIIIKDFNSSCNWSRLFIAPQEIMTNAFDLESYYNTAEQLDDGWRKMVIPLSAFDESIDFSAIAYLALPYSKSAGDFTIGIRSIIFTGGSSPYTWLGEGKMDNRHDGEGNPGQLSASYIDPSTETQMPVGAGLYVNNVFQQQVNEEPYIFSYTPVSTGELSMQVFFNFDNDRIEASSAVSVISQTGADPENDIHIIVHFDSYPQSISLKKAALKYNKDFAYSFTLDDGLISGYTNAYKLINGGTAAADGVDYPGITYTNGSGTSVKATAGLSWYSANSSGSDIHINTPSYITWNELIEVIDNGWDVFNHSYTHSAYSGTDYEAEVRLNNETVLEQTGYKLTQFVIPSGDKAYIPYVLDYGLKAIYSNKSDFAGYPGGLQVDDLPDLDGINIYKRYIYDSGYTVDELIQDFDNMASKCTGAKHLWYNEFTHRVERDTYSGSMAFENFKDYLQYIADNYGENGSDRMWMAGLQEVYEYLLIRKYLSIEQSWNGNDLNIILHTSSLPDDIRHNAISLSLVTDNSFSVELTTDGPQMDTFSQSDTTVINLSWNTDDDHGMKSGGINESVNNIYDRVLSFKAYPNPATDNLYINIVLEKEQKAELKLYGIDGKQYLSDDMFGHPGMNYWKINLRDAKTKPGFYFVFIETPSSRGYSKILIR